jgi:hypothetical protein
MSLLLLLVSDSPGISVVVGIPSVTNIPARSRIPTVNSIFTAVDGCHIPVVNVLSVACPCCFQHSCGSLAISGISCIFTFLIDVTSKIVF